MEKKTPNRQVITKFNFVQYVVKNITQLLMQLTKVTLRQRHFGIIIFTSGLQCFLSPFFAVNVGNPKKIVYHGIYFPVCIKSQK